MADLSRLDLPDPVEVPEPYALALRYGAPPPPVALPGRLALPEPLGPAGPLDLPPGLALPEPPGPDVPAPALVPGDEPPPSASADSTTIVPLPRRPGADEPAGKRRRGRRRAGGVLPWLVVGLGALLLLLALDDDDDKQRQGATDPIASAPSDPVAPVTGASGTVPGGDLTAPISPLPHGGGAALAPLVGGAGAIGSALTSDPSLSVGMPVPYGTVPVQPIRIVLRFEGQAPPARELRSLGAWIEGTQHERTRVRISRAGRLSPPVDGSHLAQTFARLRPATDRGQAWLERGTHHRRAGAYLVTGPSPQAPALAPSPMLRRATVTWTSANATSTGPLGAARANRGVRRQLARALAREIMQTANQGERG